MDGRRAAGSETPVTGGHLLKDGRGLTRAASAAEAARTGWDVVALSGNQRLHVRRCSNRSGSGYLLRVDESTAWPGMRCHWSASPDSDGRTTTRGRAGTPEEARAAAERSVAAVPHRNPEAARPYMDHQPDGGTALKQLRARMERAVGETVGGRIADEGAIDDPFCRQLARATEPVTQPAQTVLTKSRWVSYSYRLHGDDPVRVAVCLLDNPEGDVAVAWRHPAPSTGRGYRTVKARTGHGLRIVGHANADPALADTARKLLTATRTAWNDYRDAVTAALRPEE